MKKIFISYSSKDEHIANAICDMLERNRYVCWIAPRDIVPGITWAGNIVKAIKDCSLMILVYSKESNNSHQVANEIDKAFSYNITIIPFLIDNTPMNEDIEYYLSRKQWLIAYPNYEKSLSLLMDSVSKFIAVPEIGNIIKMLRENKSNKMTNLHQEDNNDTLFKFTIEDVFNIPGRGPCVTGVIIQGKLDVGNELTLHYRNGKKIVIVFGIALKRKIVDTANEGDDVGILLRGTTIEEISIGDTLTMF